MVWATLVVRRARRPEIERPSTPGNAPRRQDRLPRVHQSTGAPDLSDDARTRGKGGKHPGPEFDAEYPTLPDEAPRELRTHDADDALFVFLEDDVHRGIGEHLAR